MKAFSPKLPATAAIGMTLLAQQLTAAPPAPISPQEIAAIQVDAAPLAPAAAAEAAAAKMSLAADLATSENANQAARDLLRDANLSGVPAEGIPAPNKPLDKVASLTGATIQGEGGFYFDGVEGVFVYLKNVTVDHPDYKMSGANELKIFLAKKVPEKKASDPAEASKAEKAPKPKKEEGIGSEFDGLERIVATGAIRVIKEPIKKGEERIEASAAIFTYNKKANQITLSRGYPWVTHGKERFYAMEPDLTLRISLKPLSVITDGGRWGGFINIKEKP